MVDTGIPTSFVDDATALPISRNYPQRFPPLSVSEQRGRFSDFNGNAVSRVGTLITPMQCGSWSLPDAKFYVLSEIKLNCCLRGANLKLSSRLRRILRPLFRVRLLPLLFVMLVLTPYTAFVPAGPPRSTLSCFSARASSTSFVHVSSPTFRRLNRKVTACHWRYKLVLRRNLIASLPRAMCVASIPVPRIASFRQL